MVKRSENIVHRLFDRQICNRPSNTQLHRVRRLYENIVPGHTVYDVEFPEHAYRKFTNDGQYLIAFSRNSLELVVYRFNWFNYCLKGDATDEDELPGKSKKFGSFFTELYCLPLASGNELICKDFFLASEDSAFGLFATSTGPDTGVPASAGAVPGVPSMERITIFVVRLADGFIIDQRTYRDDFIQLAYNMGVFMYEDLLAVLSIRYQRVHILQIRESGLLVDVRTIGEFCREDDELLLSSQAQKESAFQSAQNCHRKSSGCQQQIDVTESRDTIGAETSEPWDLHSDEIGESSQYPQSGVYRADTELHLESYFRGLLGSVNRAPETIEQRTFANTSYSVNGEPSSSNANSGRRLNYVVSRREGVNFRLQRAETSVAASAISQADTQAPMSSSGSRHISGMASFQRTSQENVVGASDPPQLLVINRQGSLGSTVVQQASPSRQESQEDRRPLCGIKQRLLSYVFRSIMDQDDDRAQRMKRFFFFFQDYVDLVMWKIQFLDRYHLLIKFGSVDGVASRGSEAPQQTTFFVVYNFETTEVLEFQQNSSEEFLRLYENFADHFRVSQRYPLLMSYITSCSNNSYLREQTRCRASNAQVAKRTLASVPVKSQSHSPSVYFDHSLFQFDEKLISAHERHRPCMEHPIKFISRRRPNALKFKITPGPENGINDPRVKRVASFIFHPIFPFAMSIQHAYMQRSVVNFHFRK